MVRDEAEHLPAHVLAVDRMNVEAIEKRGGRRDAFLLVVQRADAAVDEGRRRRLAEIVRHRAEHDDELIGTIEIVDALPRLVDHHQRMHPHVALRMPFRLLLASDERLQLRKQLIDDAELERERETDRGPAWRAAAAFRFLPRCAPAADRRGGSRGTAPSCRRRASARSARRTGPRAARAGCRRRTCPRSTAFRILSSRSCAAVNGSRYSSVSGSHEMALTVKSRRRAASSIDIDGSPSTMKPFVPAAGFRFAAGKPDVDRADLVDGKLWPIGSTLPNGSSSAGSSSARNAEDLHVDVFGVDAPTTCRAPSRRRRARVRRARAPRAQCRPPKGSGSLFVHFEIIMAKS